MDISCRAQNIRHRIEEAAKRAGRRPETVRLVVVSKYRTVDEIKEAVRAGVSDFGENRIQEADVKRHELDGLNIVWHLVGHLQSNKVKRALQLFDWIHSVDRLNLACRLNRLAEENGKTQRILVQVDLAGEETKSGLPASELFDALEQMGRLQHLHVEGLMSLPPFLPEPEEVRPYFARLRELRDGALRRGGVAGPLAELSMGMSHDFEVAIEEGATMVRIGTALFGKRPSSQPSFVRGDAAPRKEGR
jgi:pyridoxal phosphate enzyme (YggS family)